MSSIIKPAPPTLNPNLREFWDTRIAPDGLPVRHRVLYGGRSSSKSWDAAGRAIAMAQFCRVRFLCTRQFQNKIEESVYTLLVKTIDRFGLRPQFAILNNKITHRRTGAEFIFYGLWRNIEEIRSLEGADIHWAEESHLLTEEQWDIIDPTIRGQGSEHWLVFNPRLVSDYTWRNFVVDPPPGTVTRKINYDENPFLSDTMRQVIAAARHRDPEKFEHVYLGEPRTDDEAVIIRRSWILAAIDAHKKLGTVPRGARRIGYDIADDGDDRNATVTAVGPLAMNSAQWKGQTDELLASHKRVYSLAKQLQARIIYDSIGVGAGAGSKFKELNAGPPRGRVLYAPFNAGGKVHQPDRQYEPGITNGDFFSNIKAQTWWTVADRFRNTYLAVTQGEQYKDDDLIFLNSGMDNLEQLIDELSTPRRDFDKAGRVKVESKEDLAKRGVKSPNLADAFVMAYNPKISAMVDYGRINS